MIEIDRKYHHWTVKATYMKKTDAGTKRYCTVECDCPAKTVLHDVEAASITRGLSKSCGHNGRGPKKGWKQNPNRKTRK